MFSKVIQPYSLSKAAVLKLFCLRNYAKLAQMRLRISPGLQYRKYKSCAIKFYILRGGANKIFTVLCPLKPPSD